MLGLRSLPHTQRAPHTFDWPSDPANGTQVALFTATDFALLGAMLSVFRLSPIGARGTDG